MLRADAILRIIEPNGQESAMCGNGVRCVADYLRRKLGKAKVRILAEVTTPSPRIKCVRQGTLPHVYQVCMGPNSRLPAQFQTALYSKVVQPCSETVDMVELALPIPLPSGRLWLALRGYVTYTSEPHLVVFAAGTPLIWEKLGLCRAHLGTFFEQEEADRSHLLRVLGDYLNERLPGQSEPVGLFNPQEGINVNIAAVEPSRTEIQVRVYERGSWNTTKACGTGATAVVAIAHQLSLLLGWRTSVVTEGSVFRPEDSSNAPSHTRSTGALVIEKRDEDWWMQGPVEHVYSGELEGWKRRLQDRIPLTDSARSYRQDLQALTLREAECATASQWI
jgi:diaminopimelate epimerase